MRAKACFQAAVILAAATAASALAGCGASSAPMAAVRTAPPSSPRAARVELADLEKRIDNARASLGLPARAEKSAGEDGTPAAAEPDLAFEPDDPAPASTSEPPRARRPADQEEDQERVSACSDNCRLSRAICHAARRICSIAGYLGDQDAAGRCKQARRDCKEARQAKSEDCSGCR